MLSAARSTAQRLLLGRESARQSPGPAEAATKLAQEATERLREERREGIADIRELLKRFEQR